jgi:C-terminal processing protease CtpA/Prc
MRKLFLALAVLSLFSGNLLNAQTVSNNTYYKRLYYTGKVWGFLKYFHSAFSYSAAGDADSSSQSALNWDSVLFQTVKDVKASASSADFNNALGKMLNSAGKMFPPSSILPSVPDSLKYNINFNWLNDPVFSSQIVARLDTVKDWFRPHNNRFVSNTALGPDYTIDSTLYKWDTNVTPDEGVRLLALFRYWNIINYFYPYKNLMDQNWDSTLTEFIPKLVNASDYKSFCLSFMELVTRINDSHSVAGSSFYRRIFGGNYYLPITIKFVENETVVTGVFTNNSDVKKGDVIKSINGVDINIIRDSLRKYSNGSNNGAINKSINSFLLVGLNQSDRMTVANDVGQREVTIQRNVSSLDYYYLTTNNDPVWKIINSGSKEYGYINMDKLQVADVDSMFNDLWDTDGIIIDSRNYPNGTLWPLINYLFKGPVYLANFLIPDIKYPGTFRWVAASSGSGNFTKYYGKNIFILMDENSISQSEYTIMGLGQYRKAIKIGSQTSGADGDVSEIYLPGGISSFITGLGVFYPNYRQTQRIGIVPDVVVYPTIAGIRAGRDEVLEAALNYNPTDVKDNLIQILDYNLQQNYPNPFNPSTTIEYQLKNSTNVKIKVFNILGQEIETLINRYENAGMHKLIFNGNHLSSGVYFYTLQANGITKTKSMVLLK